MDPRRAYNSFRSLKKKLNFFLYALLFFQTVVFINSFVAFKIPKFLINYFLSDHLQSNNVKIGSTYFTALNLIQFANLEIHENSIKSKISIHDMSIKFNSYYPRSIEIIDELIINVIKVKHKYQFMNSEIKNLVLYKKNNNFHISFHFDNDQLSTAVRGVINIKYLLNNLSEIKTDKLPSNMFVNKILQFFKEYSNLIPSPDNKINLSCFFSINEHGFINIIQDPLFNKNLHLEDFNLLANFSLSDKLISRILLNINKVTIPISESKFEINKISSSILKKTIIPKDETLNFFAELQFKSIKSTGRIKGIFPHAYLNICHKDDLIDMTIISDSNSTTCTNILKLKPGNDMFSINGRNTIIPDLINISVKRKDAHNRIMNGDLLNFNFSNPFPLSLDDSRNNIWINAKSFSVLDSKFGEYNASGLIKSDLSLFFNEVSGELGHSFVKGSFSQEWKPLCYNFMLEGRCLPTDINNWLGQWWDDIWLDFKFNNHDIPYGKFQISGNWKKVSNSYTNGLIKSKNFSYKGISISDTTVRLTADSNKTKISSKNIEHSFGSINGEISIPHKRNKSIIPLNYSLSGIYPINSGKQSLGPIIEEYLNDFNLSFLTLNSNGEIYADRNKSSTSADFQDNYLIQVFTDQNGTWNGINFDSIKGTIKSESNKLYLNFPTIKLSNGELSLNLESDLTSNEKFLKLALKNTEILKLYNSVISYQNKTGIFFISENNSTSFTKNGIIDFSLNAHGVSNNFMSFSGSGSIRIKDKALSQINLLGFISDGLSRLPLPFPSGTLKFNTLKGLFEFENGKLTFDNLVLSGHLSRVESKGSLDLQSGELDILSKIHIVGNFPFPILSQIANLTDPLSILPAVEITGHWTNPNWKISLNPLK